MDTTRKEFSALFANLSKFLIGIFLILFPLLFSIQMTDAFLLPKHLLLAAIVSLAMLSYAIHSIAEGKLRLRTTPFDIPVLLFTGIVILSAFLAVNSFDALIAVVPFLYAALLYYIIVNAIRGEGSFLFLISSLILGASATSLLTVLSFFHIYILPFSYTRSPYFSTLGSLFDQALYLVIVLPITGYFAMRFISLIARRRKENQAKPNGTDFVFTLAFFLIAAGFILTLFHLVTSQKPILLPYSNGFQIAFAAISQDAGRLLKSFLFGSGYGTFLVDFMRFKQASYNASPDLWSVTFLRSSSFVLELLSTTGILGVLSFFFIVFRVIREKTLFLPLLIAIITAFLVPFSPLLVTLFFIVLAVFTVVRAHSRAAGYNDLELHLIATTGHGTGAETGFRQIQNKQPALFPGLLLVSLLVLLGTVGYYSVKFAMSDMEFQKSLVAASQNNGSQTYALQRSAIQMFPYRDVYQRVFSQTNLALANALAQQTPAGSSPSAAIQQNVLTLIQQSINTGRNATTISPYTALNWNNLSGVYRSLIGFGQNADQFAVATNQQAIALDSNNPQQYINLGGIYYQLQLWDDAIRQFQIAAQLKPDYANAYYNIGHALEAKGQLQQAGQAYLIVKNLVAQDKDATKKISDEIEALKNRINEQNKQVAGANNEATPTPETPSANEKLNVNKPVNVLPTREPRANIEGPTISPLPAEASQTPTPGR